MKQTKNAAKSKDEYQCKKLVTKGQVNTTHKNTLTEEIRTMKYKKILETWREAMKQRL